ncbi:hypothetical protein [Halobacteriovorax sp.]|uniref:hypothetical protein n=1 Tax=Halobacteriovorax sp. TaxID=2020862 RepID=UPI003AF1F5E1
MKRLNTLIILSSIIHFQIYASCGGAFKSFLGIKKNSFYDTPEFELKEKINKLETLNRRLRNTSEHKEPAMSLSVWKKIEKLDNNLFTKHYSVNVRDWRVFFRDFEVNFISFKRMKDISDFLSSTDVTKTKLKKYLKEKEYSDEFNEFILSKFDNSPNADLFKIEVDKEAERNIINIGNDYYEYRLVREHIRDLENSDLCNKECQVELKKLMANLGVASDREKSTLPIFFKGESRPELDDITRVVHENPMALITKLKKERNSEVVNWLYSLLLQPEIVDTFMGLIYKSKHIGKYRAVRLFQAFYNARARRLHFPKINNIVKSFSNDLVKSYSNLKTVNTTIPKDELLVTFARMVDALAVKKYKLLKQYAKENDPKFYERMLAAEEKAYARGDISITHRRSVIGQLVQFIPASTPIYLYQRSKLEERATVEEVNEDGEVIESNDDGSVEVEEVIVEIEHGDEMDKTLEEVAEVIAQETSDTTRDPSSVKGNWVEKFFYRIKQFFKAKG